MWVRLESLSITKGKTFVKGKTLRKQGYTKLGILANGTVVEVCTIPDNAKVPILPYYYIS